MPFQCNIALEFLPLLYLVALFLDERPQGGKQGFDLGIHLRELGPHSRVSLFLGAA